jgi:hypothetical protein
MIGRTLAANRAAPAILAAPMRFTAPAGSRCPASLREPWRPPGPQYAAKWLPTRVRQRPLGGLSTATNGSFLRYPLCPALLSLLDVIFSPQSAFACCAAILKELIADFEFIRCQSEEILLDTDSSLDRVFFPESGVVSVVANSCPGQHLRIPLVADRTIQAAHRARGALSAEEVHTSQHAANEQLQAWGYQGFGRSNLCQRQHHRNGIG